MDDTAILSNVAKATRQQLMDGYRALLKKYQEGAAAGGEGEQKQILEKVEQYKSETDVTRALNETRGVLQGTVGELERVLVEKFAELKKFDAAIAAQQTKLKELYEIENAAGALMALLQATEDARRQTEQEKDERTQARRREEEEYKFSFDLQKRKDKENYEAEKRKLEAELSLKRTALEEEQKAFAAKEGEFAALQQQVAEFPSKLEAEKQQVETRVRAETTKDRETALLLERTEAEARKTVFEGRIKATEAVIEEQKRLVTALQEQLKASQVQLQEVVLKSIEGASGAKTLDVVNKLALEQTRASGGQR